MPITMYMISSAAVGAIVQIADWYQMRGVSSRKSFYGMATAHPDSWEMRICRGQGQKNLYDPQQDRKNEDISGV